MDYPVRVVVIMKSGKSITMTPERFFQTGELQPLVVSGAAGARGPGSLALRRRRLAKQKAAERQIEVTGAEEIEDADYYSAELANQEEGAAGARPHYTLRSQNKTKK